MSKWVGYAVSVNCGEPLGCYQGTILEADGTTITLTKAFRNGFPYPKCQVTLNAADIKDLKIIESRAEPAEQTHSTVAVTKNAKKGARATVCENLQANPSSSGDNQPCSAVCSGGGGVKAGRGGQAAPARSKPIDIQGPGPRNNKNTSHAGSYGNAGSTPKGRGAGGYDKARRRNEACFGEAAEPALADDFDFESNLALFDKRALWEQMRLAHRPDVVRHADLANYRHDENVLGEPGAGGPPRAIRLPAGLGAARLYVTDDGVRVPAAGAALRRRLWDAVWRLGLGDAALTLLARAAADVALRLAGGGRRLDPRNAHQAPAVVALVGAHVTGAAGAGTARLLAAHGTPATVHLVSARGSDPSAALRRELAAAARGGVATVTDAARLPAADVVILALHDAREGEAAAEASAALRWARAQRAAVVALEPPAAGWGVQCRATVVALLPPAVHSDLGLLYLANVAPPPQAFEELGVAYRPPFGATALLPLHPADPE